jgi:micrococcal nuclease
MQMELKKFLFSLFVILLTLTGCGTATTIEQGTVPSNDAEETANINSNKQEESKTENLVTAKVIRIVDGDTIKVTYDGIEESVRLLLVDTPETKHPSIPVQPFGPEASEFAEATLADKEIQLEFDGPERDKYDRLLAYIWVDGENFNQMLLEEGYARYAYVYDPPYTHQKEMTEAEERAKTSRVGIWSLQGYVTEEGFNQEKEENQTEDVYFKNCTEAREAGVTPLYAGDAGYREQMDGDRDGVACE